MNVWFCMLTVSLSSVHSYMKNSEEEVSHFQVKLVCDAVTLLFRARRKEQWQYCQKVKNLFHRVFKLELCYYQYLDYYSLDKLEIIPKIYDIESKRIFVLHVFYDNRKNNRYLFPYER